MKKVIDAVNEFKGEWKGVRNYIYVGSRYNRQNKSVFQFTYDSIDNDQWVPVSTRAQFNQCVEECETNFGKSVNYEDYQLKRTTESVMDKMKLTPLWLKDKTGKDMADEFISGQEVFIAQINTHAGIESKRYYLKEYWCDSGHQRQYVELGLMFSNKEDAESKCRELVGLPQLRTDKEKAIEQIMSKLMIHSNRDSMHKTIMDTIDLIASGDIDLLTWSGNNE
jgi:hypothetical protein